MIQLVEGQIVYGIGASDGYDRKTTKGKAYKVIDGGRTKYIQTDTTSDLYYATEGMSSNDLHWSKFYTDKPLEVELRIT